ncbi:FHA domain-containing protein PS1 [Vespula pensylvanica]|uniref:FHA domain-containing protein PS1 n=1 Tax=Vespula pensylvanica TaxID=30213 RepID=UPI001CBA3741|nr:FHA domain-containing protein PS1 [Vespula pensylvanica]
MDLPETQVCYDYDDIPTQKIEQPVGKEQNVQIAVLTVNSTSYPIYKGINKIGRHPDCNILFNDQSISKYHAEIEINTCPTNAWICDLNSSNRTILNNIVLRPTRYYELKNNSIIEFGRIKAVYKTCRLESEFVIPETPVQSKLKNATAVIPETPDSSLSNSSISNEGDSTTAAAQECCRKSICLRPSTNQLPQKVLKGNGKNNVVTLSSLSDSSVNDERRETDIEGKNIEDNGTTKDGDESIMQLSDKDKRNQVSEYSSETSHFSLETAYNDVSGCEQNERSTSCESEDIFESATQRVNIYLDSANVGESSSPPAKRRKSDDEDVDIDDTSQTRKICNAPGSSAPTKKTNSKDRVEELKNIENDIALATKCIQSRKDSIDPIRKESEIDDLDTLETQLICLPDFINNAKRRKTGEKDNDIDTLDTQVIELPESNHGAIKSLANVQSYEKRNDIIDIDLLNTQPLSTIYAVDAKPSSAEEVQSNLCNDTSIEDIDYETAATQVIEETEVVSKTQNDEAKRRKIILNDTLEQKLNDMFDEVNDEEVTDATAISTQSLKNILELSRYNLDRTSNEDSKLADNAVSAPVKNAKSVESSRRTSDSQDTEVYFDRLVSKRKRNVLADSQEIIHSNVATSSRRRTNKVRNAKKIESTVRSEETTDRIEKDLLNSFEISSRSSKETAGERTKTGAKLSEERDDDILTRLPEVNICGTLSDARASSTPLLEQTRSTRRSSNKRSDESKIWETGSTIKNVSETMEDANYENLKKMAEDLISNGDDKSSRRFTERKVAKREKKVGNVNSSNKPSVKRRTNKMDKGNVGRESESILTYVTDKAPKRNIIRSMTETDSKKEIEERRAKESKGNGSGMKDTKAGNTSNIDMGKESQEIAMIMNDSSIIQPRNIRKRKATNANSDGGTLNEDSNVSRKGQTNNTRYEVSKSRVKRTKFGQNNSSQSSIDSTTDDATSTVENEDDFAIFNARSRSTRSTRTITEKRKNENNTNGPKKTGRRNNDTSTDEESNRKTSTIASTPTTRRSVSFLSPNTSFSAKEKILFTGITDDEYAKVLKVLGATKVEDPSKCTILVTDKIRRTIKFLCALANAVPIVSINWLHESKKAGRFLDWENYMLKDPAMEAKYGFRLRKSLDKARERKLLDGYVVLLTPNIISPPISELRTMIASCGGKALLRPSAKLSEKTIIISHQDDLDNARKLLSKVPKNVTIQSTEFLLIGILKQELDFVRHKLI